MTKSGVLDYHYNSSMLSVECAISHGMKSGDMTRFILRGWLKFKGFALLGDCPENFHLKFAERDFEMEPL
ncbi:MAG: hypothetical protein LBH03_02505 [Holophagales bacterium]|jgi:hypothetical protein|nr:hypothetical protein [Holophagales bacterium]